MKRDGMGERDPFALDGVNPHGGCIEKDVDQVVR